MRLRNGRNAQGGYYFLSVLSRDRAPVHPCMLFGASGVYFTLVMGGLDS